jgi:hypothetical protein
MQTKLLLIPAILLALVCAPIAFADEVVVVDADNVWNLALDDATDVDRLLDDATDVDRLVGEPDVMVVKYADMFSYKSLENATEIERLVGEPGVMVVRYADIIAYKPLENATEVDRLAGEPGVIVVKYADTVTSSLSPLVHPWDLPPKGDLNGDGRLTPADAAIALRIAASGGWDANADVSGDGSVTSLDALMILQAAAGDGS